jgi:8-oxo-dGTP diphosphatase
MRVSALSYRSSFYGWLDRNSVFGDTLRRMPENKFLRPVPVVRLIVSDSSGCVLILRRAGGTTRGGDWCLPGGKIDYGDTVEESAARELEEETGLRAKNMRFLFYQDSLAPGPGQMHCINLYFECDVEGDFALNGESTEAKWIGKNELSEFTIVFRNDEALLRYWNDFSG